MTQSLAHRPGVIAGLVHALCSCCEESQPLAPHADLDATRLVCPQTLLTYLDRGDGLFEQDGERLTTAPEPGARTELGELEMLSDRPTRTGPKSRIVLEKATFA